jgi:hypothetical protein
MNKIMITGTGRCGSKMLNSSLSELGLSLGKHEVNLGKDGGSLNFGWNKFVTDTRIAPAGYTQIAVVRHPLNCISSLTTTGGHKGPYNKKNKFFVKEIASGVTPLHKSMIYYYYVNNFLSSIETDMLFCVEDLSKPEIQEQLCGLLPNITTNNFSKMLGKYGTNHNTRKHKSYTWKDLERQDLELTHKIKELSQRLGYTV